MAATQTIAPPRVGDRKMLIDGKWVDSASGKTFETINPATGDTICQVAEGDKADVDLAVKAARRAFESDAWGRMSAAERGRSELPKANGDGVRGREDRLDDERRRVRRPRGRV